MVTWILDQHGLFKRDFGHQGSIKKLWENRWKLPVCVHPIDDAFTQS